MKEGVCIECGVKIFGRIDKVFCGVICMARAYRRKRILARGPKICPWCGKEFTSLDKKYGLCCSTRCRRYKYESTPEFKKKHTERTANWRKENQEKYLEYNARTYRENIEQHRVKGRVWQKENRERVRANCNNRNARKRKLEGRISADDIKWLYEYQGNKCAVCLNVLDKSGPRMVHIDHIIPVTPKNKNYPRSSNLLDNIQILCRTCNMRKHNKLISESRFNMYQRLREVAHAQCGC